MLIMLLLFQLHLFIVSLFLLMLIIYYQFIIVITSDSYRGIQILIIVILF